MFAPRVFGFSGIASDLHHIGGALIVVTSLIPMGKPLRATRFVNGLLALVVVAVLWLGSGVPVAGRISAVIAGLLMVVLGMPRGPKHETDGSWER